MTNKEVCNYISKIENVNDFYAEQLVREGYGQNIGGYLAENTNRKPTQQEHFISYYQNKEKVTYQYLRCPQLLIFIAEAAGLSKERIKNACSHLKDYENNKKIKCENKNGNYIWRKCILRCIKSDIEISNIVKIIKESNTWDEVQEKVGKL